jgi:hypothetical protein
VKKIMLLAVVLLASVLCGCEEKVGQLEGFGAEYTHTGTKWRVIPVVVDGHKYILAVCVSSSSGSCAICPSIEGK